MTALPLSTRDAANDHRGLASGISFYATSGLSWAAPEHLSEWWGYGVFSMARARANPEPVVLMQRPEGSGSEFTRVTTAKTGSTGAYSFAGVKVNRTTDYEVRFAGNIQKGLGPSASPVKQVVVRGA